MILAGLLQFETEYKNPYSDPKKCLTVFANYDMFYTLSQIGGV